MKRTCTTRLENRNVKLRELYAKYTFPAAGRASYFPNANVKKKGQAEWKKGQEKKRREERREDKRWKEKRDEKKGEGDEETKLRREKKRCETKRKERRGKRQEKRETA